MAEDSSDGEGIDAETRRQAAAIALRGPHGLLSASYLAEIVYDILTVQGANFDRDPKPLIERIAIAVKQELPAEATVNQALTATVNATCNACGLDYSFDPREQL